MIEVDGFEDLLVGVQASRQRRVVADHLHRVNGLEGSEHALGRCEFDEEIELIDSDMLRNVGQIRQHDRKGATLLNLKNVAEHLTKVFVIQDDENDWNRRKKKAVLVSDTIGELNIPGKMLRNSEEKE